MVKGTRVERDSIGELEVPEDAYFGINTQRTLMNFRISGRPLPSEFIISLAEVKKACAQANLELGVLEERTAKAIERAADEIIFEGKYLDQFPIDIFQTGSGTQTNVNMNEVLANRASEILGYPKGKKSPVHPNDHINMSQSSNDVIPTTMHVAAVKSIRGNLLPALNTIINALNSKTEEFKGIIKVGRTHLQDAVPIPLSMEFEVYLTQMKRSLEEINSLLDDLALLPIGGTALGTGINAPSGFAESVVRRLSKAAEFSFRVNPVKAEGISSHGAIVRTSSALRSLALSCLKMASDIRLMGTGPRAGLGELSLPQNEPGSSIMAGKVNPTQAEALIQVCLQVMGNDATVALAEGHESILDLNAAKPLMIVNLLESINILSGGIHSFTEHCLKSIRPNVEKIRSDLERNLMVATRLVPILGYDRTAEIAKKANATEKTIREIIIEDGIDLGDDVDKILDPGRMV
ncbi:MAG: class II fumarate hydratase [Candidatus Thorarchaeota archaeon]|nr:MAG: class II fumarate hydratase [Candidatus Thorarchaeota archaeon]RLI58813.1 MAG: class II fumarate hydratase [Candidatus Thorarchaeota archaeon]